MSIDPEIDPIESEDDLFEHYNFVVDKGQQLLRIDKYLLLKQHFKTDKVLFNSLS